MGKISQWPLGNPANNDSLLFNQQGTSKRVIVQEFVNQYLSDAGLDSVSVIDSNITLGGSGSFYGSVQSDAATTITIPLNGSQAITEGSKWAFFNNSGVEVTFSPQSGVTLTARNDDYTLNPYKGAWCMLEKVGVDSWELYGDTIPMAVTINSEADLPDASGGVRTLAADTVYTFTGAVTTSDSIVLQDGTVIQGTGTYETGLILNGTANVSASLTSADSVRIQDVTIFGGLGNSSKLIDLDTMAKAVLEGVTIADNDSTGAVELSNIQNIIIKDCDFTPLLTGNGVTFSGTNKWLRLSGNLFSGGTSGTFIELGSATFDMVTIAHNQLEVGGGETGVSGLATSGNINASGAGLISDNIFIGAGTAISNILDSDARWTVRDNA